MPEVNAVRTQSSYCPVAIVPSNSAPSTGAPAVVKSTLVTPSRSEPQVESEIRTLGETLARVTAALGSITSASAAQAEADKAAGRGLVSGARDFSNRAGYAYSAMARSEPTLVDQVGRMAQQYLAGTLKDEALRAGLSELGFTGDTLSVGDLLGDAASTLFESGAETAAAESAQAGGAAAQNGIASSAGSALSAVGAAYSAYELFSNWGQMDPAEGAVRGATAGAYVGSQICPGFGTAVGAVVGGVIGLVGGLVKTGKHEDQVARDRVRSALMDRGIIDRDYGLKLADGTTYDIGKDGGFRIPNTDGTSRRAYEVDFGNPLAGEVVGLAQPLAAVLTGGDPKLTSDLTGYFVNAALSNASTLDDAKRNVQAIFSSFGVSPERVASGIDALSQSGRIDRNTGAAYMNGFVSLVQHG